jgi:hypothetical protein
MRPLNIGGVVPHVQLPFQIQMHHIDLRSTLRLFARAKPHDCNLHVLVHPST